MASNSDTMIEGLKTVITSLAQLKVLPDADPQFLAQIEGEIVDYVKNAGQQQINGAMGPPSQGGGMGQPGSPGDATMGMSAMGPSGMSGMGGMAQQIAPGGGAGMSGLAPQAPNGDELRRILQPPTG